MIIRVNGNIELALKAFSKRFQSIRAELKRRASYVRKGERLREKRRVAQRRLKKYQRRRQQEDEV